MKERRDLQGMVFVAFPPGGSPNRVEDLFFKDKSSVKDLPKSQLLEILVVNPQLKVEDLLKSSTEDL